MAEWKKLITSGSSAQLYDLVIDQRLINRGPVTGSHITGSFTGSFKGDGSQLTGVALDVDTYGVDLTAITPADADLLPYSDAGTDGRITVGQLKTYISGATFTKVTGDIAITAGGIATIQANSVELGVDTTGSYVAHLGTGTGVTIGSNSGEGSVPTIAVIYGSSANQAVQGNTTITINGTTNEVEITGTAAQALGGGPSYTIGLPDDVTIGNNLTVTGNLTVNGTTVVVATDNLTVEDRFILLASGSGASPGDGGLIVEQTVGGSGSAFFWDNAQSRWALTESLAANAAAATPAAFVAAVTTSDIVAYRKNGNIRVESNEVYIYVE